MRYMTEQELYHHGILGQKWGVRRFQNQDGSYTAAGKERYGIEDGKHRSLKSYALEYKDRRENKNRYSRMKKNQNLDTMSYEEMKRLNDREQLKGQIQWQQKQNDPNNWKKQLGREVLSTAARGLAEGASKELGKQLIAAPIKLAGYTGDKAISAAGWSAREMVDLATDARRQTALRNTLRVASRGVDFAGRATNGLNTAATTVGRGAMGVANRADRAFSNSARRDVSRDAGRAMGVANRADRAFSNAARSGAGRAMNAANMADRAFSNSARRDVSRDAGRAMGVANRADRAFSNAARSGANAVGNSANILDRSFSNAVTPRTSPIYGYSNLENGGGSDYMRRLRRGY